ncbi:hypothetical protein FQZ97_865000 [compost metagenome]
MMVCPRVPKWVVSLNKASTADRLASGVETLLNPKAWGLAKMRSKAVYMSTATMLGLLLATPAINAFQATT